MIYRCPHLGEPPGVHYWHPTAGDVDPDDYDCDPPTLCCADHDPRCGICRRRIAKVCDPPLCDTCYRTAKAGGKLLADAARYPDPEGVCS